MPRLFTALEVPEAVGEALAGLRGGLPGARWIEPADYHITLSFIGDIDDRLAREIDHGLSRLDRPGFEVAVDGLGAFGGARPKSVHARIVSPGAMAFQAAQERLLRRLGAPVEARAYTPHVTLARLSGEATARLTAEWLALRGGFAPRRWRAGRFVLMSSRDSVGGGPYLIEADYPLG